MEVYLREQPRYHFTSTERENTNPHHIGTTRPHIYWIPPEADHKSQGATTRPPKEHAQRMQDIPAQGRDCKGNTQPKEYNKTSLTGSSQRCRTNLPKTSYHTHHLPKMLPKKPTLSRNDHKHHITRTSSKPAVHKPQPPNCHNQPPKKPQRTLKWQGTHKAQVGISPLQSQKWLE